MEEKLEDWQDDLDGATLSEKWRDECFQGNGRMESKINL